MSPPGRPKGEYRSAQHEGTPVSENWQPVCRVEDIPVLGAHRVARVGSATPIAVFRNAQGQVFALLDQCPHKGGPLSQGIVFGDSVACPLHNWTIGLADGCAKAPDEGCTQRFTCKVEDGRVLLEADALSPVRA
jgi:nitrite reductase (NADH) small subunit